MKGHASEKGIPVFSAWERDYLGTYFHAGHSIRMAPSPVPRPWDILLKGSLLSGNRLRFGILPHFYLDNLSYLAG